MGALLLAGLAIGATMLANRLVDPYDLYASHLNLPLRREVGQASNPPMWSGASIAKIPRADKLACEVVLAGDSRSAQLTGSWRTGQRIVERDGHRILDLSVPGAGVEDSADVLASELDAGNIHPRVVMFCTSLDRFDRQTGRYMPDVFWAIRWPTLGYLPSGSVLMDSLTLVRAKPPRASASPAASTAPITGAAQPPADTGESAGVDAGLLSYQRGENIRYFRERVRGFDQSLAKNRLDRLAKLVRKLEQNGAQAIFISTPVDPALAIDARADRPADYDWFAEQLGQIAPFVDWSRPQDLPPGVTFTSRDAMHVTEPRKLWDEMYARFVKPRLGGETRGN